MRKSLLEQIIERLVNAARPIRRIRHAYAFRAVMAHLQRAGMKIKSMFFDVDTGTWYVWLDFAGNSEKQAAMVNYCNRYADKRKDYNYWKSLFEGDMLRWLYDSRPAMPEAAREFDEVVNLPFFNQAASMQQWQQQSLSTSVVNALSSVVNLARRNSNEYYHVMHVDGFDDGDAYDGVSGVTGWYAINKHVIDSAPSAPASMSWAGAAG